MTYSTEWDENGDEVVYLVEPATFSLPPNYADRERDLAFINLGADHDRRDLAVSRRSLHAAVQMHRALLAPPWGEAFAKDPRRFGSTPRPA